jgi:DDE superfamily endonuclease
MWLTTPDFPRTAPPRHSWRASTRARWARTGNSQIRASVQMASDHASLTANWRLFCPAAWDDTTVNDRAIAQQVRQRRARASIPDTMRHRERSRLALDMLDEMIKTWNLPQHPVVGDCGYREAWLFRQGLHERGLSYVLQRPHRHRAPGRCRSDRPALPRPGRPPVPAYPDPPSALRDLALAAGRRACPRLTWRTGTNKNTDNLTAATRPHFLALRVRPANRNIPATRRAALRDPADRRTATRRTRTGQVLAVEHGCPHPHSDPGPAGPLPHRLAPPHHPHRPR